MTIKDKILFFLREYGVSREDFYKETELSASNFKGAALKSELGGSKIVKILTVYKKLSPDWLLLDEGPMLRTDEPPTNSVTPSTDTLAASAKPDESILYNMYKDLQAEKEKIRLEKEAEIKELNAKIFKMSEEIGRLKAKLGEEASEDQPKEISKKTAKNAFTKPHSSQSSPDAPSVGAPLSRE